MKDVCLPPPRERMDGNGYPEGSRGDPVSLLRPHGGSVRRHDADRQTVPKGRLGTRRVIRRTADEWEGHFDPRCFKPSVKSLGIYPVGSLVRHTSQVTWAWWWSNRTKSPRPQGKSFFHKIQGLYQARKLVDLPGRCLTDAGRESASRWGLKGHPDQYWAGDAVQAAGA